MDLVDKIKKVKSKIEGKITFNENLSKFTWFNLGGPAKIIFRPNNIKELSFLYDALSLWRGYIFDCGNSMDYNFNTMFSSISKTS